MADEKAACFKEMVRDQWTHAAEAWRTWHTKFSEMSREATEAVVASADLRPGMQVLDLAGGTGEPALTVAAEVGPGGIVVCTDFIPAMVATAQENAQRAGLTNMKFEQVDAEAIPYPDGSFDRVISRFGVMFFPHIDRALADIRRVLREGGRVAFVVWAPVDQNPAFATINSVLSAHGLLQSPEPGAPTPFTFAEPGSLSKALGAAGFKEISETPRAIAWAWPGSPAEYWDFHSATLPAMRRATESLDADGARQLIDEILQSIGRRYDGKRVDFGAKIYLASAAR